MRLLLDEHISGDIAEALPQQGFDVITVAEAGSAEEDDEPLLRRAIAMGRAIVTFNADDFGPLCVKFFDEGIEHHGIILVDNHTVRASNRGGLIRALAHLQQSDVNLANQCLYLQRAPEDR